MIKMPNVGHAAVSMKFQHNPFRELKNIYCNISEFKQAVSVQIKSKSP